jgi:hypothetical protein
MTVIEQRKLQRYPLEQQPHNTVVMLRSANLHHPIRHIRDISDSGISFYLDESLDVSAKVTIEYADSKLKIDVYGRVAWCARRTDGDGYVMGVELLSPLMLYAMLRKH